MDHETAVRLEAAERYLLGQLTPQEGDEFEEHFFTCPVCAEEVRDGMALKTSLRAFWRSPTPQGEKPVARPQTQPARFLPGFIRPWLLVSAALNAVLVVALGYHFLGADPKLRRLASSPQYLQELPLLGVVRSETPVREVQAGTNRLLLTGYLQNEVSRIMFEFRDPSGKVRLSGTAPPPPREASSELHLSVTIDGLAAGDYEVSVRGVQNGSACPVGESKIRILAR